MKLLFLSAFVVLTTTSSMSQAISPQLRGLMSKTELNQNYRSLLDSKTWMHQGVLPHAFVIDTIKPNSNIVTRDTAPISLIRSFHLNLQKISKDSAIVVLNNYVGLTKTPGIYKLWQDNMPCIVPDTKEIVSIPNAWKGRVGERIKGNMPNPAMPLVTKPGKTK